MQYALIKANKVINAIVADPEFIQTIQSEYDHIEPLDTLHEQGLGIGVNWSYVNNEFIPPTVEPQAPVQVFKKITRLAFLNRFTDAEAIAIDLASQGTTIAAATMRRFQKKVDSATFIDLDRQDTRDGVLALEQMGLLEPGRALQILDSQILETERYVQSSFL